MSNTLVDVGGTPPTGLEPPDRSFSEQRTPEQVPPAQTTTNIQTSPQYFSSIGGDAGIISYQGIVPTGYKTMVRILPYDESADKSKRPPPGPAGPPTQQPQFAQFQHEPPQPQQFQQPVYQPPYQPPYQPTYQPALHPVASKPLQVRRVSAPAKKVAAPTRFTGGRGKCCDGKGKGCCGSSCGDGRAKPCCGCLCWGTESSTSADAAPTFSPPASPRRKAAQSAQQGAYRF